MMSSPESVALKELFITDSPKPIRFTTVEQILIAARSACHIPSSIQQITALLRERHHVGASSPNDFDIRDMTEITKVIVIRSFRELENVLNWTKPRILSNVEKRRTGLARVYESHKPLNIGQIDERHDLKTGTA